jgi:hypothetical protein
MWQVTSALGTLWDAIPILLAVMAIRPVSASELMRYSRRFGLEVNLDTHASIVRSIRRSRTSRLAGAAIGWSAHAVLYVFGVGIPNEGVVYAVLGYLLGAFVAALIPGSPRSAVRRASLVPRRPSDYLPRKALLAPGVAVAISAAADLAYYVGPRRAFPNPSGSAGGLVLSVVAAAATLVAIRIVVSRSQPAISPELIAVDDAMRTQAVHTLAGTGIAIAFIGTAACLLEMGNSSSVEWLRYLGVIGGICALVMVPAAWGFRRSEWHVARSTLQ